MIYLVLPKDKYRAKRSIRPRQIKSCPGSAIAAPLPRERTSLIDNTEPLRDKFFFAL